MTNNTQINLITSMNLAWLEFISWNRFTFFSIAENQNNIELTKSRLFKTPKTISNIFKKYYGNSSANIINALLNNHLEITYSLTLAFKNNHQRNIDELTKTYYINANNIITEFNRLTPFYLKTDLQELLYNHLNLTISEISTIIKNDYITELALYDKIQQNILQLSNFLIIGIFREFPDLF